MAEASLCAARCEDDRSTTNKIGVGVVSLHVARCIDDSGALPQNRHAASPPPPYLYSPCSDTSLRLGYGHAPFRVASSSRRGRAGVRRVGVRALEGGQISARGGSSAPSPRYHSDTWLARHGEIPGLTTDATETWCPPVNSAASAAEKGVRSYS
eukprot:scaffold71237_cov30-Tisochrysis_lutea.AAC.4